MSIINGNEIRKGNVIRHDGGLWRVVDSIHTMPGKGGAFQQIKGKNLRDGTKLDVRFRSSEGVDAVSLEQRDFQFLFENGDMLTFMDLETYDQIDISRELVGDPAAYLQDGMKVQVETFEDEVLGVQLPTSVVLEIVDTEPTMKGQTATSSYKPAILSNGVRVMIPPFVDKGAKIVVNTADNTYVKRAEA
jgi:elongation factor P